jgi:hypothetical protein
MMMRGCEEACKFQGYSYCNRTGGNDDDERPINGHTAAHPATSLVTLLGSWAGTATRPGRARQTAVRAGVGFPFR